MPGFTLAFRKRKKAPYEKRGRTEHYHTPAKETKAFSLELSACLRKHGDTHITLLKAVKKPGDKYSKNLIRDWLATNTAPDRAASWVLIARIERRYGLPAGHFKGILQPQTPGDLAVKSVSLNQQHVVRWHLPKNFDRLAPAKQSEIMTWMRRNVLTASTDYGKYSRDTTAGRFALRFPAIAGSSKSTRIDPRYRINVGGHFKQRSPRGGVAPIEAPRQLIQEVTNLVQFKRSTIAPSGYSRYTHWTAYTAGIRISTYSRFFGALVALPSSKVQGHGLRLEKLTMALLAVPAVWDWYLAWREKRRGFYTAYERNEIIDSMSLLQRGGGWLRQHPELARHLRPIGGLVSDSDIRRARRNWDTFCDSALHYLRNRRRELVRISRRHRDPFHAIMPVLRSASPLAEYRKISQEIVRRLPDGRKLPTARAEAIRAYLMLRIGMHAGFRQRNMRELLLCRFGNAPRSEKFLQEKRCGEIRWLPKEGIWEIYVPALAFKNWDSSFFQTNPFRLVLPNVDRLYHFIDLYLERSRPHLLGGFTDPGTFFVRTMRTNEKSGVYTTSDFYTAWKGAIIQYGIYNPYTRHGAIEGLLPHGPHSVRDVLATHMLKQTASYELAAFAIHDTPEVVKNHYSRFLPEEKSAMAAEVLNKVWRKRQNWR